MSTNFSFTKNQKLIIEKLNSLNVEYLVIGGLAVKNYYSKRKPKDLDILLPCNLINSLQVALIFRAMRMNEDPHKGWEEVLVTPGVRLACPNEFNVEVDILTSIDGIDFQSCYSRSNQINMNGLNFKIPSILDLIHMKNISLQSGNSVEAHEKDRQDILILTKLVSSVT
ncbi:hypothetical protein [Polynucleobacter sp. es-MAR-4]|uniref:hypothetical protein n=1 Tax=Polynucleobacter sp. es-MAR-4 TaxID=1855655 RepID=UPI001C0E244D|nr:hypothetical protein [Polynucleobacter sp. es-MAR-4]MBU3636487.1 hypothetical protein [Polynucleobacter sp. es-MAR-4]